MPNYEIETSEGVIRVWHSFWNERDRVTVDGTMVAETPKSPWPWVMDHEFRIQGPAGTTRFELRQAGPLGYRLRRNGTVVAERYSRATGFALGLLTVLVPFALLSDLLALLGAPVSAVDIVEEVGFWGSLLAAFTTTWWLRRRALDGPPSPPPATPAHAHDRDETA